MTPIIALILGIVLSLPLVGFARTRRPEAERLIYAVGLIVTALIYVGFGVAGGASAQWLTFEVLGLLFYGAVAWGGFKGRPWLLALGWVAHVAWDVLLHLSGAGSEYTPHWYPWTCVSFDLIIAAAVLVSSRR